MRGRSVGFILLNVIVSAIVALGIIRLLPSDDTGGEVQIATVPIVITQTLDPDGDATRISAAVDATVQSQTSAQQTEQPQVDLPPEIQTELSTANATVDPVVLTENPGAESQAQAAAGDGVPDGCIIHSVQEGDTPFAIAEEYGVDPFTFLNVNNLTEASSIGLQIGDQLIVPLPECPVDQLVASATPTSTPTDELSPTPTATATDEETEVPTETPTEEETEEPTETDAPTDTPTPTETPTSTATPSPTPTATLVIEPTAASAQLEIVEILSPGDITAEGVRIFNRGNVVDITGWTLTDADENEFVFPEQRLFTNGSIIVYTRDGESTPVVKYWGRSTAVWEAENEVATLRDANGQVQSSVLVNADDSDAETEDDEE